MKPTLSTLFILLLLTSFGTPLSAQNTRFVLAPSGLNLRKTSQPASDKLQTVPNGTKVELVTAPASMDMTIDNLKGGMAKVKVNGTIGYMFSGYLSHFPAATMDMETEDYVAQLRNNGFSVTFEEHYFDFGGAYSSSEVFYLPKLDFQEAFIVVKSLYPFAKNYDFPPFSPQKKDETYLDPVKSEFDWTDQMSVKRNQKGEITEIMFNYRGEAGERSVTIKIDKEGHNLKIESSSFAC